MNVPGDSASLSSAARFRASRAADLDDRRGRRRLERIRRPRGGDPAGRRGARSPSAAADWRSAAKPASFSAAMCWCAASTAPIAARTPATNVLSFPYQKPPGVALHDGAYLGDIVLAAETVRQEAVERGIEPKHHLQHLVVHGLLHLLGYDHQT